MELIFLSLPPWLIIRFLVHCCSALGVAINDSSLGSQFSMPQQ